MAEGLRIHHPNPAVWGQTVVVPHPGDPRTGRKPKDYHIRLDSDGNAIVSKRIWKRLEEAKNCGLSPHKFVFVNTVSKPPTQNLGGTVEERRRQFRQEQEALREITPKGFGSRVVQMQPKVHDLRPKKINKRDPKTGR